MRAWYALQLFSGGSVPKPRDEPSVRSGDPEADRVLLVGNGPCQGNGVLTHQLALPGQMSRGLRRRTGRGADVDYIGAEAMNMASSTAWLGDEPLDDYDLAVVMIGGSDAMRLTSERAWEADLRGLVARLREGMRPGSEVAIASIPKLTALSAHDGMLGKLAERHARRLDAVTESVAAESGATFFRLVTPAPDPSRSEGSPELYRLWSEIVVDGIAPALERARATAVPSTTAALERLWEWSGGPEAVRLAGQGGSAELQRLASVAQETFGVELAVVTLLDNDRVWYAMHTEVLPAYIPTELSYCKYTAVNGGPMIVPDARIDPRFSENPIVDVAMMPFYAGYPLESSTGEIIGSFCLHAAQPRTESSIALDELRDLALQAQTELWRYETTVASPMLER